MSMEGEYILELFSVVWSVVPKMIRKHFMVEILSNLPEWNQQYVVRPQVTYLHIFSVWSGAVVKCWLWLGTPSGQFLLPTSCVALFRFFIGRTQKIVQNAITVPSPVHDVWEFVKSSSQKLLGNNSKMMGLVLLQLNFPLGLVTKEYFLSLETNRQRLAFNFDLLPYNLMEIFKCTEKGPDKCFV